MKLAVIGSRNIKDYALIFQRLDEFRPYELVSGGAKGVDTIAEAYALERKLPIKIFYPKYAIYGKAAPLIRNKEIVRASDCVYAFWDGESRGTKMVIDYAESIGKKVIIVYCDPSVITYAPPVESPLGSSY